MAESQEELHKLCDQFSSVLLKEQKGDDCIKSQNQGEPKQMSIGDRQSLTARSAVIEEGSAGRTNAKLIWPEIDTAFQGRILTRVVTNKNHFEPHQFMEDVSSVVLKHVRIAIERHGFLKVSTAFNGEFVTGNKRMLKCINTRTCELFLASNLREWYELHVIKPTITSFEEFQDRDSGWTLSRIDDLMINMSKYNPWQVGCHLKLPKKIKNKEAIFNVQSSDKAFTSAVVCLIAALHPATLSETKGTRYSHFTNLNFDGIEFPMTKAQMTEFERLNKISINVYNILEEKEEQCAYTIKPICLAAEIMEKNVNLLYMQDKRNSHVGHFVWINNMSQLMSQLEKNQNKIYICSCCMHSFFSKMEFESHQLDCIKVCVLKDGTIIQSPPNKQLSFNKYSRKEQVPFVVYADLESMLEKTVRNNEECRSYQRHTIYSIGYYVHCSYDNSLSKFQIRRDTDCVSWFVKELKVLADEVKNKLDGDVGMEILSSEQEAAFHSATLCHMCGEPFQWLDKTNNPRVHDHCHLSGRYRGAAHKNCNLNYQNPYYIPIVFNNVSGYNSHLIYKEITDAFEGDTDALLITEEKYILFTKTVNHTDDIHKNKERVKLRFINLHEFLSTSLDKLVSLINEDKLKITRSQFQNLSNGDFNLLARKVFPYEYLDCVDKLTDQCLPPRKSFYNSVTGDTVSVDDYMRIVELWKRFHIRSFGEYSDLYLKTNILLLADIFENFRDNCIESYKLDPAHYYTLPEFAWDAMLKNTGVTLELLTDIDMINFIKRGMRGGLIQCSTRYARANNRYMQSYDSSKPLSYIMHFNISNLHDWAMCQPLPRADFRWVDDPSNFDVWKIARNSSTGYILEVDLEYPQRLHDAHADLPFCPTYDEPSGENPYKLFATLHDKERYVVHYRNLQQCTHYGLRITKIHRVLQFTQFPWLRDYVQLNAQLRTSALDRFEENLHKLINNTTFVNVVENMIFDNIGIRLGMNVDVKIVSEWNGRYGAQAMISKSNFHRRSVFSENFIAIEMCKPEVQLDKPIYVGMGICDMFKMCLYELHYDYMSSLCAKRILQNYKLMYTDTDRLIYRIEYDCMYNFMKCDINKFDDTSDCTHNIYVTSREHSTLPLLIKGEKNEVVITEFIALKSKMYALRVEGKEDTKEAKGVKNNVVARTITFDDYVQHLEQINKRYNMYIISKFCNKRHVISPNADTLPWGHYKVEKYLTELLEANT